MQINLLKKNHIKAKDDYRKDVRELKEEFWPCPYFEVFILERVQDLCQ